MSARWDDPSVLIPAVSGLVGAIIGGIFTLWGVKRQFTQQKKERRASIGKQMRGLKIEILASHSPAQCTEVAFRLRRFFVENPELLDEKVNREFFDEQLAVLSEAARPSDQYWTEERMLHFWAGGRDTEEGLKV